MKKARLLTPTKPHLQFRMSGQFKLIAFRNQEIHSESDWFSNMILDQGLDYLGMMSLLGPGAYPNGPMGYLQIGTGTGLSSPTQTQLESWLAACPASGSSYHESAGAPTYTATSIQYYTFAQGQITTPISEVGVGRIVNGELFSRARLVDSFGNPFTLELTAQDTLVVAYALVITPVVTPLHGVVTLEGVDYNWSAHMTNILNLGTTLSTFKMPVPNTSQPFMGIAWDPTFVQGLVYRAGTPLSPTVLVDSTVPNPTGAENINAATKNTTYTYVQGSHSAQTSVTLTATQANFVGGVQCAVLNFSFIGNTSFKVLYYFDSPVPKTSTKMLRLSFTVSWARA